MCVNLCFVVGNTFDDDEDESHCNNFTGSGKLEKSIYGSRKGPPLTHSTPQVQRSFISEADYSRVSRRTGGSGICLKCLFLP